MPREVRVPEHPIDPSRRPELGKLSTSFHGDAKTLREAVKDPIAKGWGVRERTERHLAFIAEAGKYSLDLHRYWSHVLGFAHDGYLCSDGSAGSESEWKKINGELGKFDKVLEKSITAWEEATSPYLENYNADRIKEAGGEFREYLLQVGNYARTKCNDADDLGNVKPQVVWSTVMLGVSGLLEQIGNRMGQLASGKVVEPVTMSNQTRELLERAKTDPVHEQFANQIRDTGEFRNFLKNDCTAENVGKMRARQAEIREKLRDKSLSAGESQRLREESERVNKALESFNRGIDGAEKSKLEQRGIEDAHTALNEIDRTLAFNMVRPAEEIRALLKQRNEAAEKLIALQIPFLKAAVSAADSAIQDLQNKSDTYKQGSEDARGTLAEAKNPADYWHNLKTDFLSEVEAAGGKDLRNLLDTSFNAGFNKQFKDWRDEQAKRRLDPAKLQDMASKLLETANSYSKRVELALKKLDPGFAGPIQDRLNCGLAALRESVTKELQFLFDNGAFSRSA